MTNDLGSHGNVGKPTESRESVPPPNVTAPTAAPAPPAPSGLPAPTAAPTSPNPTSFTIPDMPRSFWVCAGAIAATFLGLLGTWATVFIVSVDGLDTDDGKLLGLLAAGAGFALFRHAKSGSKRSITAVLALGVLCCLLSIAKLVDLSGEDLISVGWGLYLDVVAGATIAAAAVSLRKRV